MSFDISNLDGFTAALEDGTDVELKHPATDKPLGIVLRIVSYDSDRVRSVQRRQTDAAMRLRARNKAPTSDMLETNGREIMAASVVSWTGMEMDGQTLECTRDNVLAVLKRFPWVGEQIDAVGGDRAAFFRGTDG